MKMEKEYVKIFLKQKNGMAKLVITVTKTAVMLTHASTAAVNPL